MPPERLRVKSSNNKGGKRAREEIGNNNATENSIEERASLDIKDSDKVINISSQVQHENTRIPGYTPQRLHTLMTMCANTIASATQCPSRVLQTSSLYSYSCDAMPQQGPYSNRNNIANLSKSALILNNLSNGLSHRDLSFQPRSPSDLFTHHSDVDNFFVENPHHLLFIQNPVHVTLYKKLKSGVMIASSLGHRSSHAIWGPQYSGKRLLMSTLATSLRLVCGNSSDSNSSAISDVFRTSNTSISNNSNNSNNNTYLFDGSRTQEPVTSDSTSTSHMLVIQLDGDILRDDNDAVRGIVSDIRAFLEVGYTHDVSFFLESNNDQRHMIGENGAILTVEEFVMSTVAECSNNRALLLKPKAKADYLRAIAIEGCPLAAQSAAVRQLRCRHKGLLRLGWKPTLQALVDLGHDYRRQIGESHIYYCDMPSNMELKADNATTRALQRQELFPVIKTKIMSDISKWSDNVNTTAVVGSYINTGPAEFDLAEGLQVDEDERQADHKEQGATEMVKNKDDDREDIYNQANDEYENTKSNTKNRDYDSSSADTEKPISHLPQNDTKSVSASTVAATGGSASSSVGESLSGLQNALLYFNHIGIHISILVNNMPVFGQRCDRVTYILSGLMNEAPPMDTDSAEHESRHSTDTSTPSGGISFIVTSRTPDISLEKRLSSRLASEMLMCPLLVMKPSETVMMLFDPVAIPDELTLSPSCMECINQHQEQQQNVAILLSQQRLTNDNTGRRPLFEKNKNCIETLLSSGNIIAALHFNLFQQENVFIRHYNLLDKKLSANTKKQTMEPNAINTKRGNESEEIRQSKNHSNFHDIFRDNQLLSVLYADVKNTNKFSYNKGNNVSLQNTEDSPYTAKHLSASQWRIIHRRRLLRVLIRQMNETRRLLSMAELIGTAIHPKKAQDKVQQLNKILELSLSDVNQNNTRDITNTEQLSLRPSAKCQWVVPIVEDPEIVENQQDYQLSYRDATNIVAMSTNSTPITWQYKPHVHAVHLIIRPFLLSLQTTNLFLDISGTDVLASKWVMTEVISGRGGLTACLGVVMDSTNMYNLVPYGGESSPDVSYPMSPMSSLCRSVGERERLCRLLSMRSRAQAICIQGLRSSSHQISNFNTDVTTPPIFPPTAHHAHLDGLEKGTFVKSGYFSREHFLILAMLYVRLDAGQKRTFIELTEDIETNFIPQLMYMRIKNTNTSSDDNNDLSTRVASNVSSHQNKPTLRLTKIQEGLMEAFMELLDWGLLCITTAGAVRGARSVTSLSNSVLYGGDVGISGGLWRIHAFLRQILNDPKLSEMVGIDEQQRGQISNLVR